MIGVLVSAGFTVYGSDHRGHGRTAPSAEQLGDFREGGFNLLVEDIVHLSRIAKEENPGKPFILLGHSRASFAAQQYVPEHSREIDGLIPPDQVLSMDSRVWQVRRRQEQIS